MTTSSNRVLAGLFLAVSSVFACDVQAQQVCCTVPDLGSLVREIGGNQVTVTVFAKGTEDPHFVDARPSFIKSLSQAELFVQVGLQLELGWVPPLLQSARNGSVLPGARGFVDASTVVQALEIPTGRVDRSMGDVHPTGNPHYLSDPLSGLKVARLICDKLIELRPQQKTYFEERYQAFAERLCARLIGEELAKKYSVDDVPKLALLYQHGKLMDYLKSQRQESLLGGWLGVMQPHLGAKVVDDHNIWPYFVRTFGIKIIAHLEPKPGIPPTTQHLGEVVKQMRAEKVRVVLANAYFDARHAQFVSQQSGARVVNMAHQVGARQGADDYVSTIDHNVRQLVSALEESK
jgi:ABC-type Zn uptake system ZnuABC Zn-binding protein ZnuA